MNSKKTHVSDCKLTERLLQNAAVIGTYAYVKSLEAYFPCKTQAHMLVQCRAGGSISLEQYCQAQDAGSMQYDIEC